MNKKYSRKCIVNNQIYDINKLLRFALIDKKEIRIDQNYDLLGRGAYVLNNEQSLSMLFEKRLLNKSFKMNISKEVYEKLEKEVKEIWLKKSKENLI